MPNTPLLRRFNRPERPSIRMITGVAVLATACMATLLAAPPPAMAQEGGATVTESQTGQTRRVTIGIGKSVIVDLPRDAKEVFVANPAVANAVVRSARKVFVIAMAVGQTSLFFMDAEGRQIAAVDVNVQRDVGPIKGAIDRALPGSAVIVEQLNDGVLLSGSVTSPDQAAQAVAIAARYVGAADRVANSLAIKGGDQVMLKVTVAEVQRQVVKQLGVDLNGSFALGSVDISGIGAAQILTENAFPANNGFQGGNGGIQFGSTNSATLRAFERTGVIRTLAEPTLTAISGETAKFLAGGEVPVVESVTRDTTGTQITYVYKPIGVTLDFTPVVLNNGRISVKVGTEVREIDPQTSTIPIAGITQPGFRSRRANTTVEIPSGGSLVMAGMLQDQTRQIINGTPGLMNLPVLGQLFRSRDFQRQETELMIIVTPYLAKPIDRNATALPTDGFADASDPSTWLLGRINRLYGAKGQQVPNPALNGRYGFIID
ncbi:MAG: type II and III secretion system protein family protein [Labrys sp. (in: a-proteobacteria)]